MDFCDWNSKKIVLFLRLRTHQIRVDPDIFKLLDEDNFNFTVFGEIVL